MTDLAATVRENSATLVRLHSRIDETFRRRAASKAAQEEWREACAEFHRSYSDLAFPGGLHHWEAFLTRAPEQMEAAITFLEVDPWFFRSGYLKQIIWGRLKAAPLTEKQQRRLEAIALAYLNKRTYLEFWYMVRFVCVRGSEIFWATVATVASDDLSEVGAKAGWLLLAKKNYPVKNWVGREYARARYQSGYVVNLRFAESGNTTLG